MTWTTLQKFWNMEEFEVALCEIPFIVRGGPRFHTWLR